MRQRTTASALATLALVAGLAVGQQPPPPPAKTVDPTDALIQKALANDPDVQVARAKLSLAEAELVKARQAAVARALALRATVEERKTVLDASLIELRHAEAGAKAGGVPHSDVLQVQVKVSVAKAALARAETEFKLLTGDGPKAAAPASGSTVTPDVLAGIFTGIYKDDAAIARLANDLNRRQDVRALAGPIPTRLAKMLEKKVSLGEKGQTVTLAAALDVFKSRVGFDIPVRPIPNPVPEIVSDGVELPVIAWLQMYQDLGGRQHDEFAFYVREYGILVASRQTVPPDAVSLTAFWRAVSGEAAQPVPAPKEAPGQQHDFPHGKLPAVLKAKVGDVILIRLPVKTADVESAKAEGNNPALALRVETANGMAVVTVRATRPVRAQVNWSVTDTAGRLFAERGREVEFE
ncbi:MAG TPA: TolC family protein [Urbifossiella sp.]|jgi:hypothetical protein|nr:TolC family protein [Urbifossiella sp.]